MAPLAERFVRLRLDSRSFPAELKKATTGPAMSKMGAAAGSDWAKGFLKSAQAHLDKATLSVKVKPDWSGFKTPPGIPRQKAPTTGGGTPDRQAPVKVPVELDPLVKQFQAELRRQTAALAKDVQARIPVRPETAALREDIADKIRAVEQQLKVKVPAGAEARQFETDLRALVREVEQQIRVQLPVEQHGGAEAGRAAARAANLAAGPIKLKVDGGSGLPGLSNLPALAGTAASGFNSVSQAASGAAGSASKFGSALTSLASGSAGTAVQVGLVALAITAIPAAAGAAIGAVYALGGALASLPAIGVGLGAVVGTLALGFKGLGDHFKKTAGGGGGAAKSMSAVRNATRAVTQAQRDLLKATRDLDRARADEIERIDDLGRSLRGARLDEEDAAVGVAKALQALAEAKATGDVNAIGEADRAYRRSLLTLDETRDRTGDLAQEQDKAAKVGVEGSDQVQQALERQRDATERLQAAQEALAEAQKSGGGGGGAAKELMKLAPAAEEVVRKLKQLKPVFEEIRLAVQQELFRGVAGELQNLADAWKKPLKDTLTSYASTFNGLFKNLSASVRNPEFIGNITSAAETFRANFDKIGRAVTGPLVGAFGQLARAAKPFIDTLGDKVTKLVEDFSAWIDKADKSGALNQFFKDAAFYFNQLWDVGKNVLGIIGQVFGIITGTKTDGGAKAMFEGLNKQLVMFREWLKDPENQKRLKEIFENIGKFVEKGYQLTTWITEKGLPALSALIGGVQGVKAKFDEWSSGVDRAKSIIIGAFGIISGNWALNVGLIGGQINNLVGTFNNIRNRLSFGMFDPLYGAARTALNNVIGLFNSLNLGLNFSIGGSRIGTAISGIGRKLAAGGIARATPGGIQATIAEGGKDEVVSPVEQMQDYIRTAVREANETSPAQGGGDIVIPVYIGQDLVDTIVVSAVKRQKVTIAKTVASADKRLSYAG